MEPTRSGVTLTDGAGGPPLPEPLQTLLAWCVTTIKAGATRDTIRLDTLPDAALAALELIPGSPTPNAAACQAAALLWASTAPAAHRGAGIEVTAADVLDAARGLIASARIETLRRNGYVDVRGVRGSILSPKAEWRIAPTGKMHDLAAALGNRGATGARGG